MNQARWQVLVGRLSIRTAALVATLLCALPGAWLVHGVRGGDSPAPEQTGSLAPSERAAAPDPPQHVTAVVPAKVWTVTLVDDLFPERRTPEKPQPKPRPFRAELVAITGEGDLLRAFVRDEEMDRYVNLAVGDRLPSGAEVTRIGDRTVVFAVNGAPITLELAK